MEGGRGGGEEGKRLSVYSRGLALVGSHVTPAGPEMKNQPREPDLISLHFIYLFILLLSCFFCGNSNLFFYLFLLRLLPRKRWRLKDNAGLMLCMGVILCGYTQTLIL